MEDGKYRIGEAAELVGVKPYVLRFWESEFPQLAPFRTAKGQRHYSEEDIELLQRIKYLLYEKGLTIDGARKLLANKGQDEDLEDLAATEETIPAEEDVRDLLVQVKDELLTLRQTLAGQDEESA